MKRVLLSGFVVLTFIAYSFQQRGESQGVILPTTGNKATSSTPAPTTTQTTPSTSNATQTAQSTSSQQTGQYKDGTYTGDAADAYYGNIQVKVYVRGGKITDVQFLQYPNSRRTSVEINQQAMPYLKQEAIQTQNSHVDIISGATYTSEAFIQSIASALAKAH